jgi:hypothetical protein
MEEGLNSVLLLIVHELLIFKVGVLPTVLSEADVEDAILWVIP